ncbi:MAG: tRNA (adenosine(37)-N6)-threonylcarbamoyltransferase complex ATPase subunit type 1 TsaE [Epsilonproteobacteria bacterium]|nr:tRNA (adenosine(37)-N6)-threonylcarbamoyltransferase complex ATPase subunit type 1 TsaE [Campylobacterota bacterium]
MEISFTHASLSSTVTTHILPLLDKYSIFTFTGPLGAGKTTLIREVLRQCGITQHITSPTFGYLNVYQNSNGQTFHHFDLYRIDSLESFIGQGFNEYLLPVGHNTYTLIEWPQLIKPLLERSSLMPYTRHIELKHCPDNHDTRLLRING